jgi:polar amino acid transport system substrate-binding protein
MAQRRGLRGESRVTPAGWALLAGLWLVVTLGLLMPPRASNHGLPVSALARGIRVGIANEPPFGYVDSALGRVTGEAPEIARAVLARLGAPEMEVIATEFRSLIPGLRAGRFDVIAAGMYITPARCEQVLFSRPTYRIGEALVVRRDNPKRLHSYEDVARSGDAVLGLVSGAIELAYAEAARIPRARIVMLKDASAAVDSLRAGHIDAYAGTALTARGLIDKAGASELELAEPFSQPVVDGAEAWGYGAFAFRKSDRALRDAWSLELERFLGTPEHLALVRPFGFTARELPGSVRAEELCRRAGTDS